MIGFDFRISNFEFRIFLLRLTLFHSHIAMTKNGIEYVNASGDDAAEASPAIKPPTKPGVFQRLKAMMAQDERDQHIAELSENQALQAENEGLLEQLTVLAAQNSEISRQLSEAQASYATAQAQIDDLKGQIEKLDALKSKESVNQAAARVAAENHVDLSQLPGTAESDGETQMEKLESAFLAAAPGSTHRARIAAEIRELRAQGRRRK